ncbi:MAG: hypothetical protein ABWY35_09535 [Pseudorhodoplanes sp.]
MPASYARPAFAAAIVATSVLIHLGMLGVIVMAERRGLARSDTETVEVELVKPEVLLEEQKKQEEKKKPFQFEMPKFDQQKPDVAKQRQQQQQQQAASQAAPQAQSAVQSKPNPKASQQSAAASPDKPSTDKPSTDKPSTDKPSSEEPTQSAEPPPAENQEKPLVPSGGAPSETKAKLTAEEIAAFRAEIQKCWELPVGLPDAMKLEVVLRVALTRKGTLFVPPELLKAPASVNGPRLVGIAMKAMTGCGPYRSLPVAKYNEWKVLDLKFLATGMAGLDTTKVDISKLPKG